MPIQRRKDHALIALIFISALLAVDQYSKFLVRCRLTVGDSVPIIKDVLHITSVRNTGAAFGLFKNSLSLFILVSSLAILLISALILRAIKRGRFLSDWLFNFGLIFIVSGAVGNLIDRLKFGYVIDFIDVRIWPVFNIADSVITIGTLLLILSFLK